MQVCFGSGVRGLARFCIQGFFGASWGLIGIPKIKAPFLEFPKQRGTLIVRFYAGRPGKNAPRRTAFYVARTLEDALETVPERRTHCNFRFMGHFLAWIGRVLAVPTASGLGLQAQQ